MEVTKSRKKLDIAVLEALTALNTIDTVLYDRLNVQINVASNALDQFTVQAKVQSDAPFINVATVGASFTALSFPMLSASGDLTTQAVGNGSFIMDCSGYVAVKLSAASGNAGGSVVDLYWGLREL